MLDQGIRSPERMARRILSQRRKAGGAGGRTRGALQVNLFPTLILPVLAAPVETPQTINDDAAEATGTAWRLYGQTVSSSHQD